MGNLSRRVLAFVLGIVFTIVGGVGAVAAGLYWAYKNVKPIALVAPETNEQDSPYGELYGSTVEEVLAYYGELKRKKDLTLSRKDDIKKASALLSRLEGELMQKAEALASHRRLAAETLEEGVLSVLRFLDMPKIRFCVMTEPIPPGPDGAESIRFAISPNTGEGLRPLSAIASGGEMSRIMLALQLKMGRSRSADSFVFDEIDTGISGATAQKIGICLRELSREKQVFCVTHSAQVATLAHRHFLVKKEEAEGRTETDLVLLSQEEALAESARLLSGVRVGSAALEAAAKLRAEGLSEQGGKAGFRDDAGF